jgi:hypothetical protein
LFFLIQIIPPGGCVRGLTWATPGHTLMRDE